MELGMRKFWKCDLSVVQQCVKLTLTLMASKQKKQENKVYFIVNLNIDLVFHFSGDDILYSASMDFSLKSWNLETQKQIDSATDHCDYVQCLAVKTG